MIKTLISIIVPIYNGEKYLVQCIESLVNQTMKNIEVILVDDGSIDKSGIICDKYAKRDNRIIVIHQENSGVSKARKNGVNNTSGEYLMFVDADDWIDENTCEEAYKATYNNSMDAVLFSYIREYEDKSFPEYLFKRDIEFKGDDVIDVLLKRVVGLTGKELSTPLKFDSLSAMYMKLYKRKYISDDIEFVDLKEYGHHEDTIFNLQVFQKMKKIIYIDKAMYHYRKFSEESISKTFSLDYFVKWQKHLDYMEQFIAENNRLEGFSEAMQNRIALESIGLVLKETSSNNPRSIFQKIEYIKKNMSNSRYKEAFAQLSLKYMPIHWKFFFFFCKQNFSIGILTLAYFMKFLKSRL